MRNSVLMYALLTLISVCAEQAYGQLSYTREADGVSVLIDGELFTRYLIQSGPRPVLWPIVGPNGKEVTRAFPVSDARPGEEKDHIHHRSMWIGYEGFNGNDFWHEFEAHRTRPFPLGSIAHRKFTKLQSDRETVTIATENDWLDHDNQLVCRDKRRLRFSANNDQRWIDFHFELLTASGDLQIGDSKEGLFAIRVAPSMRADACLGGSIVTSTGKRNEEAWGTHAQWCDYYGPLDGERSGIAILCHPDSDTPTQRWHVRPYGLFAANPFGELAFTDPDSEVTERPLKLTLKAGKSLQMYFRIIFHRGDDQQAKIADQFVRYSTQPRKP